MTRKVLSAVLALSLLLSMLSFAGAVSEGSLSNFQKTNTYSTGQFTDVSSSSWYAGTVQSAYELGLVKGASTTTFNPDGNITIAETLALACRLHSIYYGGDGTFEQGSPWYQVYVDYAIENGILQSGTFSSYTKKATRAQFASIMAAALPSSALTACNNIASGSLPDVTATETYASAVYLLYNAGILTGSDKYGTFSPDSNIKRSEVATVVTRMADTSTRKTFTLVEKPTLDQMKNDVTAILGAMRDGYLALIDSMQTMIEYYELTAAGKDTVQDATKYMGQASRYMSSADTYFQQAMSLTDEAMETYNYDSKAYGYLKQAHTLFQKLFSGLGISIDNTTTTSSIVGEITDLICDLSDYVVVLINQEEK